MYRKLAMFLVLIMTIGFAAGVSARGKKEITNTKVYVFGYAKSFSDSVNYMTVIQELPEAQVDKKGFLLNREFYSNLFKYHIEREFKTGHQTVVTFYSTKRSDIEKKFLRMRRRLLNQSSTIREIPLSDFHYISYAEAERKAAEMEAEGNQ